MDTKEFGSFIAQQRKEIGMTQKELAEKLMVTDKAISRWENGHGYPDIETLEALSDSLHISLLELMHSEKNKTDTVSVEDASRTISDTIKMNIGSRRKERIFTMVFLICSLVIILILSLFKRTNIIAVITSAVGLLYLFGAVMMFVDYKRFRSFKFIFYAMMMIIIVAAILFLLMAVSINIH